MATDDERPHEIICPKNWGIAKIIIVPNAVFEVCIAVIRLRYLTSRPFLALILLYKLIIDPTIFSWRAQLWNIIFIVFIMKYYGLWNFGLSIHSIFP